MSQYNEPWSIDPLYLFVMDKNGEKIEFCGSEENENRLHRMITSVNYCAGEPDASLELFTAKEQVDLKVKFFNEANTYRDLCGELLKQLKDAQDTLAHCKADVGYSNRQYKTAVAIHCAITKAEEIMGDKS